MFCSSDKNDIRGKRCTRFNLSGQHELSVQWHLATLKNLNADANANDSIDFKCVPIYRHHW